VQLYNVYSKKIPQYKINVELGWNVSPLYNNTILWILYTCVVDIGYYANREIMVHIESTF
jgi:hypothetical protein